MGKSGGGDDGDNPYGPHRHGRYNPHDPGDDEYAGREGKGNKADKHGGASEGPYGPGKGPPPAPAARQPVVLKPAPVAPEPEPVPEPVPAPGTEAGRDDNQGGDDTIHPEGESQDEYEDEGCNDPNCTFCNGLESLLERLERPGEIQRPSDDPDCNEPPTPSPSQLPEGYTIPDSDSDANADSDTEMARSRSDDSSVDLYNAGIPNDAMDAQATADEDEDTPGPTPSPDPGPTPTPRPSDDEPQAPSLNHPYFPSWACDGFSQLELMRVAARWGHHNKVQYTPQVDIQGSVRQSSRDWHLGMHLNVLFVILFQFIQQPHQRAYQPQAGQCR